MDNRQDLITLIGAYGKAVVDSSKTPDDRIAAMRAIEDFCDAAVLVEREACAVTAWEKSGDVYVAGAIRARPAP